MKAEIIQKAELLLHSLKTRTDSEVAKPVEISLLLNQLAELYLELLREQNRIGSGLKTDSKAAGFGETDSLRAENLKNSGSLIQSTSLSSETLVTEQKPGTSSPAEAELKQSHEIAASAEQASEKLVFEERSFPQSDPPGPGPIAEKFPEAEPLKSAPPSINEQFKAEGNTINQKLAQNTADLNSSVSRKALSSLIDLNTALQFKKGLFGGQEELFNQTIKYLSSVKDENVAKGFVTEKLAPKLKWDPQNEQVIAFMQLLDKSFGK
jgi:hypothetical protein